MIQNSMNPLSFSGQVSCSLGELAKKTLLQLGIDQRLLRDFDNNLSVSLSFDQAPDVLISVSDDRLWIWSNFTEVRDSLISANANQILTILMEPLENVESGQLAFCKGRDGYELKALVNLECLKLGDEAALGVLLEEFYKRMESLYQVIC
ncbi:hypothetical protein [Chromobacterium vaccinii]|uniref:InvB/SpaK family type III secretion system chaperone n=1 Tax=Chromobacterium vaccinii TaxID=1108595 RepID=UPI001E5A2E14|nr:hypothetical protein [Chromobacterium vaccinii]MCD4501693.1 hypothetical protein [Chromobacterium vaccinii]